MEASAKGGKDAGGSTIGVITRFYPHSNANRWIDDVITVGTIVERLQKLISLGDGYVVLKGGTGTLLELAATWEMMNKHVIERKPLVVLRDFWNGVVKTIQDELIYERQEESTHIVSMARTPADCVDILLDGIGVRYEA